MQSSFNQKTLHRLATQGLAPAELKHQTHSDNLDLSLELWRAQGLTLVKKHGSYFFATKFTPIEEAVFCIVDIETNGSKIEKHQIIELSAIKVKNGKIIDRFDFLVECHEINEHITQLTGIDVSMTYNAPPLKQVLYQFRTFLDDAVFVAHDIKFDYNFISASMQKVGLEPLLNRGVCSLALAHRTIKSYKYGLSYLNEYFNLYPNATHHRAMSDVITTYELFKLSLKNIEASVNNVEDLIKFSKEGKKIKRPKTDPLAEEGEA